MGFNGVAATTEGDMIYRARSNKFLFCTQDSSTTYGRQKIENFNKEAYDQGYDSGGNMG